MGAFVVGDVEFAADIEDREPAVADSNACTVSGAISDCAQIRTTLSAMAFPLTAHCHGLFMGRAGSRVAAKRDLLI